MYKEPKIQRESQTHNNYIHSLGISNNSCNLIWSWKKNNVNERYFYHMNFKWKSLNEFLNAMHFVNYRSGHTVATDYRDSQS